MCEARVAGRRGRSRLIRISGPLRAPHQLHVIRVILLCAVRRVASRRVSVPLRTSTQHVLRVSQTSTSAPPAARLLRHDIHHSHNTRGKCAASCRTDRLADGYAVYTTSFQCRVLFRSGRRGAAPSGALRPPGTRRGAARIEEQTCARVCDCCGDLSLRNGTKRNGTEHRAASSSSLSTDFPLPRRFKSTANPYYIQYFSVRI